MNHIFIIGNCTADPERRSTRDGIAVTTFTVAVNQRTSAQAKDADFFRVTAWRGLADICAQYLAKGRKVAATGEVHLHTFEKDGKARATLEVTASDVEFLSPREAAAEAPKNAVKTDAQTGFVQVDDDELPF